MSRYLLALTSALALLAPNVASADDSPLNFSLPELSSSAHTTPLALAPKKKKAELMATASVGTASLLAIPNLGIALGVGLRIEMKDWVVDVDGQYAFSGVLLVDETGSSSRPVTNRAALSVGLARYIPTVDDHALYVGAGIGVGYVGFEAPFESGVGAGAELRGTIGYELFRSKEMRFVLQADTYLPIYLVYTDSYGALVPVVTAKAGLVFKPDGTLARLLVLFGLASG